MDEDGDSYYYAAASGGERLANAFAVKSAEAAIPEIQEQLSLRVEGIPLNSLYPLLEQSGMSRNEIHQGILDAMCQEMIRAGKAKDWDNDMLNEFLLQILPLIYLEPFCQVMVELVLEHSPKVSDRVFAKLSAARSFVADSPRELQRIFYARDKNQFVMLVRVMCQQYMDDPKIKALSRECRAASIADVLDMRKSFVMIKGLVELVADNEQLFHYVREVFRELFGQLGVPAVCSFRFDFFMAMCANGQMGLCKQDLSFEMIWHVNEALRKGFDDEARLSNMQMIINKHKKGSSDRNVLADVAMVFQDPVVANVLAARILARLQAMVVEPGEPKNDPNIKWCTEMLNLGTHALRMQQSRLTAMPTLDENEIYNFFYYRIASVIADDNLRQKRNSLLQRRDSMDTSESTQTTGSEAKTASWAEKEHASLRRNEICRRVFAQYVVDRIDKRDLAAVRRVIPTILATKPSPDDPDVLYVEVYESLMHSFINVLTRLHRVRLLLVEGFSRLVEEFLIPMASWKPSVHELVVQLYVAIYNDEVAKALAKHGTQESLVQVRRWAEKTFLQGAQMEGKMHLYYNLAAMSRKPFQGDYGLNETDSPRLHAFIHGHEERIAIESE